MKAVRTSRVIFMGAGVIACATLLSMSIARAETPHRSVNVTTSDRARDGAVQTLVATLADDGKRVTRVPASERPGLVESDLAAADALGAGATFVPINPYRAFDSRAYVDGLLPAG